MISQDQATRFLEAYGKKLGTSYGTFASVVAPSVLLGCSWGFFTDKQYSDLGVANLEVPNVFSLNRVKGGWLVVADPGSLVKRLQEIAPGYFTSERIHDAEVLRLNSQVSFEKLLAKGNSEIQLGFYSVIELTNQVDVDGVALPVFTINLSTLLTSAEKAGYFIKVAGELVTCQWALQNSSEVLMHLPLSPNGDALLITLGR